MVASCSPSEGIFDDQLFEKFIASASWRCPSKISFLWPSTKETCVLIDRNQFCPMINSVETAALAITHLQKKPCSMGPFSDAGFQLLLTAKPSFFTRCLCSYSSHTTKPHSSCLVLLQEHCLYWHEQLPSCQEGFGRTFLDDSKKVIDEWSFSFRIEGFKKRLTSLCDHCGLQLLYSCYWVSEGNLMHASWENECP